MSSINLFKFEEKEVRFVDGLPVANDVAKVLGYSDPISTIKNNVDKEYKVKVSQPYPVNSQIIVLKEAGIYQLVFGSKLQSAKKFQHWVFDEVLPKIRETGNYSTNQPDMSIVLAAIDSMRSEFNAQLAPIQQELTELRMLNQAVTQSSGIQKQINAQAQDDFANYKTLTFIDVVKTFRPFYVQVPKIISRAKHSVGKVFATEQEKELGKISGKYVFSGWEIQTAINCLDRAAKEVFIENYDTSLPLIELIEKMEADRKGK